MRDYIMTYVAITDAEIDVDSPVTQVLMTKIRDNADFSALPLNVTIVSTPVSSVDFTSFNASQYNSYEIEFQNVIPSTDNSALHIRTSSDGGATYDSGASDYTYSAFIKTSTGTDFARSSTGATFGLIADAIGNAANEDGASGIIRIYGPHLARRTGMNHQTSTSAGDGSTRFTTGHIMRMASADVDAVQVFFSAGNIASGTIIFRGFK
jgi:hypothetical protein